MFFPDTAAAFVPVALLLVVSFVALVAGTVLRTWPDRIQRLTADYDGFALYLSPEAHRAHIALSGTVLIGVSFATLLAAACML